MLGRLGEFDRAIAACREAADRHGHAALALRVAGLRSDQEREGRRSAVAAAESRARSAAVGGDREAAIAACREVLDLAPGHTWAITTALGLLVDLGRLDEAERSLAPLQMASRVEADRWAARIRALRERAAVDAGAKPAAVPEIAWVGDRDPVPPPAPVAAGPGRSAIARGFLEDHWQKLILGLAVLLILVSSTVGAAMVLGDRLWMAEGKCLLATAYTLMFAGFGRWLARWGADRAGRIMRLTTLIVLPVNFALVGELPGLGRSSPTGLAVLAVDSAAMMGLAWLGCRSLGISGGRATPATLIAMGMVDALTPRSAPFAGVFAAILGVSGLFAASGEWLARWIGRRREVDPAAPTDAPYFAFGLLAFSYLCAVGRLGGYVLGMPSTLYALPTMLAAFAAVRVAEGLGAPGRSDRSAATLRLAGYGLSALAFALGMARPEASSALIVGNTLATATVGLALYGRALWSERRPAFLYAGFAALFLANFAAIDLASDFLATLEGRIGQSLGYGRKLPPPFRALNGLALNGFLAGLAVVFARRWGDDRLARHCHRIGLPMSVAACVLSGFDPLAAVLTMGGYAVAYGVATWLFAEPRVAYLACAAFAGASVAGVAHRGELSAGAWSLALAAVGLTLWATCRALAIGRVPPAYRAPVVGSTRMVAVVAMAIAAMAAWPSGPPSWTIASAGWTLAFLYLLIGLETPRRSVASAAGGGAAVAGLLTVQLAGARAGWPVGGAGLGAWAATVAILYQAAGPWLRGLGRRREARSGRPSRASVYPGPLFVLGLILAGLATRLVGSDLVDGVPIPTPRDLLGVAATMGLVAIGLAIASGWSWRSAWLAYPTVLAGSAATVAGSLALGLARGGSAPASLAIGCGGLGLALIGLGDRIGDRATCWRALHRGPLLVGAMLAVALAWAAAGFGGPDARAITIALTLTALTLALAARQVPGRLVVHLALASGLAAWLVGMGVGGFDGPDDLPRPGLLLLIYLVAGLAVAEVARRLARGAARGSSGAALEEFAAVGGLVAIAMGSAGLATGDWPRLTAVLALGSAVFLRLGGLRREGGLVLLGLALAWLATLGATRWGVGARDPGIILGAFALTTAVDGLVASGLGRMGRRRGSGPIVLGPLDILGIVLAAASFAMGVAGPLLTLDAYPAAVAALLLTIPALALSAAIERAAWRTYGAIVVGVVAAYLTLFELGRGRAGHVSSLGVLASLLAVATWGLNRLASREAWSGWRGVFAVPLRNATIALAVLAIGPDWGSPGPLFLASVPFLLLLNASPAAGWLYPALGLMVASGAVAASDRWGTRSLTPGAVGAAFGSWGLGLALARWKPGARRRPGRPVGLAYEAPPLHAAMVLGAAALGLRLDAVISLGEPWTASPWVPAAVGVLSLLMLKPYPARGWADGFVFLMSTSAVLARGVRLDSPMSWGLAVLTLALAWRAAGRGAAGAVVRRRLGVGFDRLPESCDQWSLGLMALGAVPVAARVVGATLAGTVGALVLDPPPSPIEWREGLVAVLLLEANREWAGRAAPGAWSRYGWHATALLGLWWLGVEGSPIMARLGLVPASILPAVAGAHALAAAWMAGRSADARLAVFGTGLALVAVVLTGGRLDPAATATLLLATAASARVAASFGWATVAGLASGLWGLGLSCVAGLAAHRLGWARSPIEPAALAVGQAVAALGLVVAGGRARGREAGLARVVERFAAATLAVAAGSVGLSTLGQGAPAGAGVALVGVGVMAAVGSMSVILATRWTSMTMAFAAQASVLLGFAAYRSGFAVPPMGDPAALLILAGVDLGVAEVAGRGRRWFALPTLAAGLALPLISIGLAARDGVIGDGPLFVLFAAGTFYAATSGRLRRKGLGYAAAVLYNAALWVLWARVGWKLDDAPQFYAIPVGFSTILFAEANVRSLGRSRVDAIRGAGLALIYLALAVPIWRTASLTAWAAVLGVSMMGIFAGIGFRSRAFLWLGLAGFVLDVLFQLGRVGMEHALAKWAIMLVLGILLVLFVALNEKRQLLATIRKYVAVVRDWE